MGAERDLPLTRLRSSNAFIFALQEFLCDARVPRLPSC
jgi:hypothetical protein